MDGPQGFAEEPHLLNLKVMRLSAPSLARHQAPFFLDPTEDAPTDDILNSFRTALARKEASNPSSIGSLEPLGSTDHTMRDLPLSPMLSLPASFGTISLGETFTASLSLSNDSPYPVASPRLLAEMQSNTQKVVVGERIARPRQTSSAGTVVQQDQAGSDGKEQKGGKGILDPGRSLDLKVGYEMRELGMNVLVVSVTYESSTGPRDFVKYYKFNVTAPLAIKTKVHLPTSPSALLNPDEREKIYLEVHVQNVSPGSLVFEKVELQTVPGLTWLRGAEEVNPSGEDPGPPMGSVVNATRQTDVTEPLSPGNSKQYLFCLSPSQRPAFPTSSLFPPSYNPGTVLPLGRLDLVWRSAYGERGHLLTAMLNRRAPPPGAFSSTIRVSGVQQPSSTRSLENGVDKVVPHGSPSSVAPPLPPKTGIALTNARDGAYELDLVVLECDRKSAVVFEGMKMKLRLAIGEVGPFKQPGEQVLHLAIQYLTERQRAEEEERPNGVLVTGPTEVSGTSTPLMITQRPSSLDLRTQGGPSRTSSPRPGTPAGYSLGIPSGSSVTTPRSVSRALPPPPPPSIPQQDEYEAIEEDFPPIPEPNAPSPFAVSSMPIDRYGAVGQLGPSLIVLHPVHVRPLARPSSHRDESPRSSLDGERVPPPPAPAADKRKEGCIDFEIQLMPEREGLAFAGGLRVLMLNDREDCSKGGRVLGEWPSLGEIYIAV